MNIENNTANGGTAGVQNGTPCAPSDTDSGLTGPLPLAMAYVPKQYWRNLYDQTKALMEGTLFEELNFPFLGVKLGDSHE